MPSQNPNPFIARVIQRRPDRPISKFQPDAGNFERLKPTVDKKLKVPAPSVP